MHMYSAARTSSRKRSVPASSSSTASTGFSASSMTSSWRHGPKSQSALTSCGSRLRPSLFKLSRSLASRGVSSRVMVPSTAQRSTYRSRMRSGGRSSAARSSSTSSCQYALTSGTSSVGQMRLMLHLSKQSRNGKSSRQTSTARSVLSGQRCPSSLTQSAQ